MNILNILYNFNMAMFNESLNNQYTKVGVLRNVYKKIHEKYPELFSQELMDKYFEEITYSSQLVNEFSELNNDPIEKIKTLFNLIGRLSDKDKYILESIVGLTPCLRTPKFALSLKLSEQELITFSCFEIPKALMKETHHKKTLLKSIKLAKSSLENIDIRKKHLASCLEDLSNANNVYKYYKTVDNKRELQISKNKYDKAFKNANELELLKHHEITIKNYEEFIKSGMIKTDALNKVLDSNPELKKVYLSFVESKSVQGKSRMLNGDNFEKLVKDNIKKLMNQFGISDVDNIKAFTKINIGNGYNEKTKKFNKYIEEQKKVIVKNNSKVKKVKIFLPDIDILVGIVSETQFIILDVFQVKSYVGDIEKAINQSKRVEKYIPNSNVDLYGVKIDDTKIKEELPNVKEIIIHPAYRSLTIISNNFDDSVLYTSQTRPKLINNLASRCMNMGMRKGNEILETTNEMNDILSQENKSIRALVPQIIGFNEKTCEFSLPIK